MPEQLPYDLGYDPKRVVYTGLPTGSDTSLMMVPAEGSGLIGVVFEEEDLLDQDGDILSVEDVEPGDVFDAYYQFFAETYPASTQAERIIFVEHGGEEALESHRDEIESRSRD